MLGTDSGNDLGNLGTVSRHMRTYENRKTAIRSRGELEAWNSSINSRKKGRRGSQGRQDKEAWGFPKPPSVLVLLLFSFSLCPSIKIARTKPKPKQK